MSEFGGSRVLWECGCGWYGFPAGMVTTASNGRACPACGATGAMESRFDARLIGIGRGGLASDYGRTGDRRAWVDLANAEVTCASLVARNLMAIAHDCAHCGASIRRVPVIVHAGKHLGAYHHHCWKAALCWYGFTWPLHVDVDMVRTGGDCLCEICGQEHRCHPRDGNCLAWEGQPFLRILCDGRRVKL